MKVKKYTAGTIQEAMKRVKEDLGHDAVILNSKAVETGGFFGFFTKKQVEVLAASDPDLAEPVKEERNTIAVDPSENFAVKRELEELKMEYRKLAAGSSGFKLPDPIEKLRNVLNEQEVGSPIAEDTVRQLLEFWYQAAENQNDEACRKEAERILVQSIKHLPYHRMEDRKSFIAVAGPTGVGKTTTIVKLAADCLVNENKSIAFITADTYRISAIEQLRTYAKILNAPIEVCYSREDFENAKKKFSHIDHVFIDTAGRNYKNNQYIEDLTNFLGSDEDIDLFLTLSASTKKKDIHTLIGHFESLQYKQLIVTKIDETDTFGGIYEAARLFEKGIAFFSTGQNVPDDMIPASRETLVQMILGGKE
ncbi:flagellar biosynthesis protein FlhF [Bacillus sp. FJAT-42376]|uniref:flagellar biosynthesis protein FlhF n=1 Tax=Bacillus sp. FJAT-42376 TaxID=2014076 RepID=UPI000F4F0628|nr:flagellar biosynthesis protein FlhF [Bacillus sp. FJAT-42376]AZB42957.1 flagellar biosynthesis protein FlhF [Bacillus sp. FJAT-42376]